MNNRIAFRTLLPAIALLATACSDVTDPTSPKVQTNLTSEAPDELGMFHRFVSMGTSISMGWQSEGVIGAGQRQSWTAQLAELAGRQQSLPLIAAPGCRSPFAAPLASGLRLSGESAAINPGAASCAGNEAGVMLPAQNVAVAAANTIDALTATPESKQSDASYRLLYPHVLPSQTTQLQAALNQSPKFISVEFGGNEVLNSRSGIAIPGATLVPVATWAPQYTQLADAVSGAVKRGIMVGLVNDVASFPSFRRGSEIWADRATMLAAFNIEVLPDCDASANLIFVPVRIPTAVARGLGKRQAGAGTEVFSCTGGNAVTQDFVLTPGEVAIVNTQLAAMNAHISATAERVGYAYVALEALYGRSDVKPTYSTVALMTTATPYGFAVSLDGIHPNAAGHSILAAAAARAINARYGTNIPETPAQLALR